QRREYSIKLFDRQSKKEIDSFSVPAGTNFDVAVFSPNDSFVATDAPDKSVAVWELSSKSRVQSLPGPGDPVLSITFAPDQKTVAAAFIYGKFRVWDLKTGGLKFE